MRIEKLRVNHMERPLGYLLEKVSLSWIVVEARGTKATESQIEIARDPEFGDKVFDSGRQEGIDSLDYAPPVTFAEGVRYYWRVHVWDDAGDDAVSDVSYFETAVTMKQAKWIRPSFDGKVHPMFRKTLERRKKVGKARLYICGLGLYEAYLNGEKIGEEYLTPYNNDYNLWIQYQTYDVTDQWKDGTNVLGVMLGNG